MINLIDVLHSKSVLPTSTFNLLQVSPARWHHDLSVTPRNCRVQPTHLKIWESQPHHTYILVRYVPAYRVRFKFAFA